MKIILTEEEYKALLGEPAKRLEAAKAALLHNLRTTVPVEFAPHFIPGDPGLRADRAASVEAAAQGVSRNSGRPFCSREEAVEAFQKLRMEYGAILKVIDDTIKP